MNQFRHGLNSKTEDYHPAARNYTCTWRI